MITQVRANRMLCLLSSKRVRTSLIYSLTWRNSMGRVETLNLIEKRLKRLSSHNQLRKISLIRAYHLLMLRLTSWSSKDLSKIRSSILTMQRNCWRKSWKIEKNRIRVSILSRTLGYTQTEEDARWVAYHLP